MAEYDISPPTHSPSLPSLPDSQRNRSILVITQEQEGMQREKEKIEVMATVHT